MTTSHPLVAWRAGRSLATSPLPPGQAHVRGAAGEVTPRAPVPSPRAPGPPFHRPASFLTRSPDSFPSLPPLCAWTLWGHPTALPDTPQDGGLIPQLPENGPRLSTSAGSNCPARSLLLPGGRWWPADARVRWPSRSAPPLPALRATSCGAPRGPVGPGSGWPPAASPVSSAALLSKPRQGLLSSVTRLFRI